MELSLNELVLAQEALLGIKDFKYGKENTLQSLLDKLGSEIEDTMKKEIRYRVISMKFDLKGMHIISNTTVETLQDANEVMFRQETSQDIYQKVSITNANCIAPMQIHTAKHYNATNGDFHHLVVWIFYPISAEINDDDF
jgi:hypothetical protein